MTARATDDIRVHDAMSDVARKLRWLERIAGVIDGMLRYGAVAEHIPPLAFCAALDVAEKELHTVHRRIEIARSWLISERGLPVSRRIDLGPELFRFETMQHWAEKGKSWYANCGLRLAQTVAIDAAGRIVVSGAEFRRADEEDLYPVVVYSIGAAT